MVRDGGSGEEGGRVEVLASCLKIGGRREGALRGFRWRRREVRERRDIDSLSGRGGGRRRRKEEEERVLLSRRLFVYHDLLAT